MRDLFAPVNVTNQPYFREINDHEPYKLCWLPFIRANWRKIVNKKRKLRRDLPSASLEDASPHQINKGENKTDRHIQQETKRKCGTKYKDLMLFCLFHFNSFRCIYMLCMMIPFLRIFRWGTLPGIQFIAIIPSRASSLITNKAISIEVVLFPKGNEYFWGKACMAKRSNKQNTIRSSWMMIMMAWQGSGRVAVALVW